MGRRRSRDEGGTSPLVHINPRDDHLSQQRRAPLTVDELRLLGSHDALPSAQREAADERARRERRTRNGLIALFGIVLVGAVVGVSLGIVSHQKNRGGATGNPNYDEYPDVKSDDFDVLSEPDDDAAVNERRERYEAMYSMAENVSGPVVLGPGSGTAQRSALRWIVNWDPAQIAPDDESIVERYVLTTIFFALNGPDWHMTTRWLVDDDLCDWYGVDCREVLLADGITVDRVVTSLALPQNNLKGSIPAEIASLEYLQDLSLHTNQIGMTIPDSIGNLVNLETLALHNNTLTGNIPNSVGNMRKLVNLLLHANKLVGRLPREVGNLMHLEQLHLYENTLYGPLPTEVGLLHNLKRMWLSRNRFSGRVPRELGSMVSLECLYLDENFLTGPIPGQIAGASMLTDIRMNSNELTGEVPYEIGDLRNLELLYIDNNKLEGAIPFTLGKLSKLQELALHKNRFNQFIPQELGELVGLEVLVLGENALTGTVPDSFSKLVNLKKLRLYRNNLGGQIPDLSQCNVMDDLELHENAFDGRIPPWIGAFSNMKNLILSRNQFKGPIPRSFEALMHLTRLKVEGNYLVGGLPNGVCNWREKLTELVVDCDIECECCTACLASDQQMIISAKGLN